MQCENMILTPTEDGQLDLSRCDNEVLNPTVEEKILSRTIKLFYCFDCLKALGYLKEEDFD